MKLAYSTNAFKCYSVHETIRAIADLGFDGIEWLADVPHLYPPHWLDFADDGTVTDDSRVRGVMIAMAGRQLQTSNLNAFTVCAVHDTFHHPNWFEPDEAQRRFRIEHTKRALRLAQRVGAPGMSVQPGGHVQAFSREKSMELFLDGLYEVAPVARECGVRILVEPEPELLLENSEDFIAFAERGLKPRGLLDCVKMNCDIGHLHCAGEDAAESVRVLAPYIGHVHVEDIADGVHDHKIIGHGDIDWPAVFTALHDIGYDGWVTLELYPYLHDPIGAGRESIEILREFVPAKRKQRVTGLAMNAH